MIPTGKKKAPKLGATKTYFHNIKIKFLSNESFDTFMGLYQGC